MSRLLKASGQQFEDDPPEVVIRVCKCQSAGVSVVVTNRAVWCLRNFSLAGLRLVSNTSVCVTVNFIGECAPSIY